MLMSPSTALPDPTRQAEFYADVALKRLIAWVVDTVLIGALCLVILPFTAFTALFFLPFLYLVVGFAYRVLTLAGRSSTWGMRLVGIEFRDITGARMSFWLALVHTLGYSLSMAFVVPQVVSAVLMLTSPRAQGLSDLVLGTAALNRAARW